MREMRFLVGSNPNLKSESPLQDLVMRALMETGGWSIESMRAPGYGMMERVENEFRSMMEFRAAAPLPDRAQVVLDKAVVEVGMDRLSFVSDLIAMGLTYPLSDPLSVTQLEWYSSNKVGAAKRTMSPSARGENKLPAMLPNRLPIYLTTDNFELDIRTLKMSQRMGMPLDNNLAKQCTRSVNEAIEDAAINGATTLDGQDLAVAGYEAPGLVNAPNAETQNLTAAAWSTAPVGATVFTEVQAMVAKLEGNKKFGPYHLYLPTNVNNAFDADYDTTSPSRGLTIRERILKIPQIKAIRMADMMPRGNGATPPIGAKVALVQMTSDVVDIVTGQQPTIIPWTSLDGFTIYNLVMAIMVPRVRSDYNGDSGICIGTTA